MISLHQALRRLAETIHPLGATQQLPLPHALGHILAEEITAPGDLPPFANSAMDGYALCLTQSNPDSTLEVIGTSRAGQPFRGKIQTGQCVRIFTGAPLPPGCNAVIMQEEVEREGRQVHLKRLPFPGENVRPAGEDIRCGERVLERGHRLGAADLGLLAALGINSVTVFQKPRVAYFSTGDELCPLEEPPLPGQIHDSNRYSLHGLLAPLPVSPHDLGQIGDDLETTSDLLATAGREYDAVISTGGASVGEADLLRQALARVGKIHLWKVAIKPGKPFIFGRVQRAWYFGLPGNPVSVHVSFTQILRPALWQLAGSHPLRPLRLHVPCRNRLEKRPGRMEFQRGRLQLDPQEGMSVTALAGQGSHQLATLSQANCFIVLAAENGGVSAGETVEVEPFEPWLTDV